MRTVEEILAEVWEDWRDCPLEAVDTHWALVLPTEEVVFAEDVVEHVQRIADELVEIGVKTGSCEDTNLQAVAAVIEGFRRRIIAALDAAVYQESGVRWACAGCVHADTEGWCKAHEVYVEPLWICEDWEPPNAGEKPSSSSCC